MSQVVLDCSTTLSWFFRDEVKQQNREILDRVDKFGAVVPSNWPSEILNVLLVGVRRGRLTFDEIPGIIDMLSALSIEVDPEPSFPPEFHVCELARDHHLSIYDAAYLALALREELPLATLDRELKRAGNAAGVECL